MEAIEINPDASHWRVTAKTESEASNRNSEIERRTDELYEMISEDDFHKIERIIRKSCNFESILFGSTEKGLKSIIQREVEIMVDEEHKQIMKFGRY